MYRIRFHGRGGQGIKTAAHMLGRAFFLEGLQVQDAPRYGAERRGAPIFAYVRADRVTIQERGIIHRPDLIIAADSSLLVIPAAGVLAGATEGTVLLIQDHQPAQVWEEALDFPGQLVMLPAAAPSQVGGGEQLQQRYVGVSCVGAAARLVGLIGWNTLERAIRQEVASSGAEILETNLERAWQGYQSLAGQEGLVVESGSLPVQGYDKPAWVKLPFEDAQISAPVVSAQATSLAIKTGLWRTLRPVLDPRLCHRCWWVCSTFCPDGTIQVGEDGYPRLEYEYCKGCMICVSQCPWQAIQPVSEVGKNEPAQPREAVET